MKKFKIQIETDFDKKEIGIMFGLGWIEEYFSISIWFGPLYFRINIFIEEKPDERDAS